MTINGPLMKKECHSLWLLREDKIFLLEGKRTNANDLTSDSVLYLFLQTNYQI